MSELRYRDIAAAGYDDGVGCMTRQVVPGLLRMAGLTSGLRVLDIAAGTGLASEAAAATVGPSGRITAADISPAMLEQASKRLSGLPHVTLEVQDGTRLTFPDAHLDSVICNMGLMYFPDAARGLAEFHRVLRPGGRATVSVFGSADRPFWSTVFFAIESVASIEIGTGAKLHSLAELPRLRERFDAAGFRYIETASEILHLEYPSFDAYFAGVDLGAGAAGQAYMALPEGVRSRVREDVRCRVDDKGGRLDVEVAISFASDRK